MNALMNIIYYLLERRGDSHKYMLYKRTLITGDRFQPLIYPSPTYIKQTYKLCCSTQKLKKKPDTMINVYKDIFDENKINTFAIAL